MEKYNHMIYVERKKGCNKNVFGRIFFFLNTPIRETFEQIHDHEINQSSKK